MVILRTSIAISCCNAAPAGEKAHGMHGELDGSHGHPLGDHGKFLKGADRLYSELLKVPFLVAVEPSLTVTLPALTVKAGRSLSAVVRMDRLHPAMLPAP